MSIKTKLRQNLLLTLSACLSLLFAVKSGLVNAEQTIEVYWEDLMPQDYVMPPVEMDHSGSMAQVAPNAPVVTKFNNKRVQVPGFVVPLEGEADNITEFLLVPYFGACIHVPPPPSNQIIYVKMVEGVPIDSLYDAVWVEGTLSTERWEGELASVGYSLQGLDVWGFDG